MAGRRQKAQEGPISATGEPIPAVKAKGQGGTENPGYEPENGTVGQLVAEFQEAKRERDDAHERMTQAREDKTRANRRMQASMTRMWRM